VQAGRLNTGEEATNDIDRRKANHGRAVIIRDQNQNVVATEFAAQLIGRTDFILTKDVWTAVQARVTLHAKETASRYGLLMDPAIKSKQPNQNDGEGAGCTSFVAMCMFYSGAISRKTANPVWTRM